MITLDTFIVVIIGLFAIIIALAIYSHKGLVSGLKSTNLKLKKTNSEMEINFSKLQKEHNVCQEKIAEQDSKFRFLAKFTFDSGMGTLKFGDIHYCTACVLEFKETKLDPHGNDYKCPTCGVDYELGKTILKPPDR